MMIIKVVNRLDNHPNLLNEMNKIRMMMIITLMTRRYTTRLEISGGGGDGDDGDDDDGDGDDSDEDKSSEYSESFEFTTEEDIYSNNSLGDKSDDYDNYDDYDEISKIFEDYSAPDYEPFQPFQPPSNSNQFL